MPSHVYDDKVLKLEQCDNVVGFLAVYRICFAMAAFFAFFCIIMIKVNSSKDLRAKLQNGYKDLSFHCIFVAFYSVVFGHVPCGMS